MADKVLDRSNSIYIKTVPGKGRGVFANIRFEVGEVIDRAPTWGFDGATAKLLDRTGVFEYYFLRYDRHLKGDPVAGYVVFGWSSIVNHSSNPNARSVWTEEESGAWVSVVAIKDIEIDEEITHRYSNLSAYPHTIKFID